MVEWPKCEKIGRSESDFQVATKKTTHEAKAEKRTKAKAFFDEILCNREFMNVFENS